MRIHHAATRSAFIAATSQQGQCEALRDAFSGNPEVRIYGAGAQHLRTVVLGPFGINSNTPRGLTCGAAVSDTPVAPSTPGEAGITPVLWEFRDGSTVIFDTAAITHGAIKALCRPTFGSVVFTANPALPADPAPPYSIPSAGQVEFIGTNTAADVYPAAEGWPATAWRYSLFGSFGGGTLVEQYSAHGAYCMTTGGHNHADNHGIGGFNFSTGAWFRLDNANGVPRLSADPHSYPESATTGAPHYEITGSEVPAPPHAYRNLVALPLGDKGSVCWITRAAICQEARNSESSHRLDLATRLWSRMATTGSVLSEPECDAVLDTPRNRVWLPTATPQNFSRVKYLDLSDLTIKESAANAGGFYQTVLAGYHACFMHEGLLMRNTGATGLWYFDPDDATAGYAECTVSGTLPTNTQNRWARHSDGAYYSFDGDAPSAVVARIRPPVNPKTGTWVADTITLGATLAARAYYDNPTNKPHHYTRLFYVPSIDCIAWIADSTTPVAIFKPPALP